MNIIKKYIVKARENCRETSIPLKICFLLIGNIIFPILLASCGFVFKLYINNFTYLFSQLILLIIYSVLFYNKKDLKNFVIPIFVSLLIIMCSIFFTTIIYDGSVDGWGYHNPAILKLSEGWNPLYEHFDDESKLGIWSEHYPKAIWLYGASLFKLTNIFFCGCSFNIIILFATLFLLYDIFKQKKFNSLLSAIFSIIISFNTIAVAQLFTLYNDGVFGLCILSLLLMYNLIVTKNYKINIVTLFIVSSYLSVLANIKFNGALYAFLIALIYSVILMMKKVIKFDKGLIKYVVTIGFFVGIVASNTYLPNIIYHKNIGYPVIGENKIEIIKQYIPNYIHPLDGNIEAFAKSITSASFLEYKYSPFYTASLNDYICASASDCRVNGFGPLYQIIVIISGVFFVIYILKLLIKLLKKEITLKVYIKDNYLKYIPFTIMLLFFLLAPATWWVRYVPFMHSVPLLLFITFIEDYKKINIQTILFYTLIVIYFISLFGISSNMLKQTINFSNNINKEVEYLQSTSKNNILNIAPIDKNLTYNSYRINTTYKYLNNLDLDYKIVKTNECKIISNLDNLAISVVDCSGDNNDTKN